jgi:hypothetical protein
VLHEFGVFSADLPERGQHGDRRAQTAHRNSLFVTNLIEARGIELQNFLDGEIVLADRRGLIFVMIEISGRKKKDISSSAKILPRALPTVTSAS